MYIADWTEDRITKEHLDGGCRRCGGICHDVNGLCPECQMDDIERAYDAAKEEGRLEKSH